MRQTSNIDAALRYNEGPPKPVECFDAQRNSSIIAYACRLAEIIAEACDNFFATLDRLYAFRPCRAP
jgi:hypothetical protein